MKRIIGLLTVLLVAMISLGSFLEKDSVFLNVFLKNFNTTVTIVSKQEAFLSFLPSEEKCRASDRCVSRCVSKCIERETPTESALS